VSLVCGEDRPLLAAIERLINRRIEQRTITGFEPGSSYHAAAPRHEPQRQQRHERGRQPIGQQHHRKGGNHPQQNRQEHRHEPHAPAQGQWSGHQKRPQTQQPAQPRQHSQHGDRQPAPQRAQTQPFPALFGTYRRKAG